MFYVLQEGDGIEGMCSFFGTTNRSEQYITNIWLNISSYIFIILLFIGIYLTKKTTRIYTGGGYMLTAFFLLLSITKAVCSKPSLYFKQDLPPTLLGSLLVFIPLGILSIPCLLFVFSWAREQAKDGLIDKLDRGLQSAWFFRTCAVLTSICLCILVFYSFSLDCRQDEGITLIFIKYSYADLIASTALDVHPPLYYCITKLFVDWLLLLFPFMSMVYAAKLVSVLPCALLALICLTVVRREWGNYVGGMGALAVVSMPCLLEYAQEIRMYSWSELWLTCCWLWAYKVYKYNRYRDWFAVALFGILTAWTQYIYCVGAAIPYLLLGIWSLRQRHIQRWCMLAGLTVAGCIPWLLVVIYCRGQALPIVPDWMKPLTWRDICQFILLPVKDIIAFFVLGIVASVTWLHRKSAEGAKSLYGLSGLLLPLVFIIATAAISLLFVPIVVSRARYICPTLGCMWLGAFICADAVRSKHLRTLLSCVVLFMSIPNVISFMRVQRHGREGAEQVHRFIKQDDIKIISFQDAYTLYSICTPADKPVYFIGKVPHAYLQKYIQREVYEIDAHQLKEMMTKGEQLYYLPTARKDVPHVKKILSSHELKLAAPKEFKMRGGTELKQFYRIEPVSKK